MSDRPPSDLNGRIGSHKRRYKKVLQDLHSIISRELLGVDDHIFEPSSTIESTAFHLIQEANQLRSLLEVEQ